MPPQHLLEVSKNPFCVLAPKKEINDPTFLPSPDPFSETEINKVISSPGPGPGVAGLGEEPRGDCRCLGTVCGTGMSGRLGTKEQQAGLHPLCQTLVGRQSCQKQSISP